MSRRALALLAAVGALVLGVVVGVTHAAFSSVADSTGTFTADTRFDGLRMATGSYTGNGADARAITAPGFRPDVVIVKASTAQVGVMASSSMPADATKPLSGSVALASNHIESLDESGFTVGTNARVNASGVTYRWVALKADGTTLSVGSYTGNNSNNHSITGVGFSPSFVAVLGPGATDPVLRMTGMNRAFEFDGGTGSGSQIRSLNSGGFTVGNDAAVNQGGSTFSYVAFDDVSGTSKVGSYTGNASASRSINGTGFSPDFVLVRANDTSTGRPARMRSTSLTGTSSQGFDALADVLTSITGLNSNGFQIGLDGSVNGNGVAYYYLALQDVGS